MRKFFLFSTLSLLSCICSMAWEPRISSEPIRVNGHQWDHTMNIQFANGRLLTPMPGIVLQWVKTYPYYNRNIAGVIDFNAEFNTPVRFRYGMTQGSFTPYSLYTFTVLDGGLFKDLTGLSRVVNIPGTINTIGEQCFQNSGIQGEPGNYYPASLQNLGHHAFAQCRSLSGNLWTPEHVSYIQDGTYADCTGLTGWLFVQPAVHTIGNEAFVRCSNMNGNITMHEGLQTIGNYAFYDCNHLTGRLYIPNSVRNIGVAAFAECRSLNGDLDYADNTPYVPENCFLNCHNLTGNLILSGNTQWIGKTAFQNCWSFNGGINLGGHVHTIGNQAFENCHSLRGTLDLRSVVNIGPAAFHDCYSLDGNLLLGGSLTAIPNGVFNNCQRLTGSLNIPSAQYIGPDAFYNCYSLNETLSLPGNCQYIANDAFQQCRSLCGDLNIPSAVWIGDRAFQNCQSFDGRLYLPGNLTSIGLAAFWDCHRLSGDLVFPGSLQVIGQEAFVRCYNLTGNVVIPASVHTVGYHAFWECVNLESMTFAPGSQVTTGLNSGAWALCHSLKYVDMTNCQPLTAAVVTRGGTDNSPFCWMDPYTLVYLPNGTDANKILAGEENFVVNGQCANFVVYDAHGNYKAGRGCDYPIKHQFTAAKANFTREFSGKDASTLFLPYPTDLPIGMTAYELQGTKNRGGHTLFSFRPVPTGQRLEANKGYVVLVTDGGTHRLPEMHNVVVPVTPSLAACSSSATNNPDWKLGGTTEFISNAFGAALHAWVLGGNNTWEDVHPANPNGYVHSFRAFLYSLSGAVPAKAFSMVFDEGTTDVNRIEVGESEVVSGRYPIYSLDGHYLGRDYKALPRGNIYIVNGKKFYKY